MQCCMNLCAYSTVQYRGCVHLVSQPLLLPFEAPLIRQNRFLADGTRERESVAWLLSNSPPPSRLPSLLFLMINRCLPDEDED